MIIVTEKVLNETVAAILVRAAAGSDPRFNVEVLVAREHGRGRGWS
jgi:hypothetical protein